MGGLVALSDMVSDVDDKSRVNFFGSRMNRMEFHLVSSCSFTFISLRIVLDRSIPLAHLQRTNLTDIRRIADP
jgi:hypothetical protein